MTTRNIASKPADMIMGNIRCDATVGTLADRVGRRCARWAKWEIRNRDATHRRCAQHAQKIIIRGRSDLVAIVRAW